MSRQLAGSTRLAGGERLAALSVDLDEIGCYCDIHGLVPPSEDARHAIYDKALPRLLRMFAEEHVTATFFVIGRDAPRNAEHLRKIVELGHEVANHSFAHAYDLSRWPRAAQAEDVRRAQEAIESHSGVRPVGFRAPGYTMTDGLMDVLSEEGFAYDSSVFPCPAYYGAKVSAIAAIYALHRAGLRERVSESVVDTPQVLRASGNPYRVGRPYYTRDTASQDRAGLCELPIGVTDTVTGRLPFIGTSVVLAGRLGASVLARGMARRPLANLELHGIDLADADEDGLTFLRDHQPDLQRTARAKETALRAAISELRRQGRQFVTLKEAASKLCG